jgi:trans-2-enoyl-CoA reductase
MALKGAGNSTLTYNAVNISQYLNTNTLTNTIAELEATVLTSTAEETIAGLGSYELTLEGDWSKTIDDLLGPDSITGTKRTVVVTYGSGASDVTYTWTTNGFLTSYEINATATDKIVLSGTLRLNGAPVRA